MAVVMFRANTETSVNPVRIVRIRKVPTTATTPTISGSRAATSEPKTMIRAAKVIGAVTSSAFCRSASACSLTCRVTSPTPVTATVSGPRSPVYSSEMSPDASIR
jgi:hypothetical protein